VKKTSLKNYIKNLKKFKNNPIEFYKKTIIQLIYAILYEMASLTIIETGQARYLLISKFAEKYNLSYQELKDFDGDDFWGNREKNGRDWGANQSSSTLQENIGNKIYDLKLTVSDDGLYAQEYATGGIGAASGTYNKKTYPSPLVEEIKGRDNTKFKIRHLTYVRSLIATGNYGSLRKLNYNKLVNDMCNDIENGLFT